MISVILTINLVQQDWKNPQRVIESDILSYYAYLPATYIYRDLYFDFIIQNNSFFAQRFWLNDTPNGEKAILTSMGLSYLYAPFFRIAHFVAPRMGYTPDGYSEPYKIALIASCLFYLAIGLYFLRRVLLHYFSDRIAAMTIIAVTLGTNLLYYTTREAPLSHAYNFSLISIFLYLTIRWHETPKLKYTMILGLISGLITLIRPSNIVVLLIFIFWDVKSWRDFAGRINYFVKSWKSIMIMAGAFIIVWVPQFIYWKAVTGSFFYYSYGPVGGNFYFNNPQIFNQLFSYRKGWLLYTPMMAFALIGIPFLVKRLKGLVLPTSIYIIAMIYILSSWWSWWYGGGFGLRSYVDTYGLLAIPLAMFIDWGSTKKIIIRITMALIITLTLSLNLFQTYQYTKGILHYDGITQQAYWNVFLKTERPPHFYEMLWRPDYDLSRQGIYPETPEKPYVEITDENCVDVYILKIKRNPEWMALIKEKAQKRGITTDEMLRFDAEWICNRKFKNQ